MVDPVTIGALAASALSMAAEAALKGLVGEAAKEAYQALRAKVAGWLGDDLDALEKEPASKGRQLTIAEALDRQLESDQAEVRTLAQRLVATLREGGNIGLDVGHLEAMEVQLGNIKVGGAGSTGARFHDAEIRGAFKTGDIEVETPPGKN
jgi:hypothetical protein